MIFIEMTSSDILISIAINLICGAVVSAGFLFFVVNRLRPNFDISDHICCIDDPRPDLQGKKRYSFKIVNKSKYTAFDADVELYFMVPLSHAGSNQNVSMKVLKIRTSNLKSIPRFRDKPHKDDPFNLFALHIHTNENIYDMLSQESGFIELRLTVRHGLSTLAKTFTKQFGHTNVIFKEYKFRYAADTGVMPINQTI